MNQNKNMKPVMWLKENDVFVADDGRSWRVNSLVVPENNNCTEIGSKPKPYVIVAEYMGKIQNFYYHSCKLVEVK